MYRPTVRYADCYQQYVDNLFQVTHLDRNQIIRAALFTAAHSPGFLKLMHQNRRGDVPLPSPLWQLKQSDLSRGQSSKAREEERDVNDCNDRNGKVEDDIRVVEPGTRVTKIDGRQPEEQGSERKVSKRIQTSGGIQIRIG